MHTCYSDLHSVTFALGTGDVRRYSTCETAAAVLM